MKPLTGSGSRGVVADAPFVEFIEGFLLGSPISYNFASFIPIPNGSSHAPYSSAAPFVSSLGVVRGLSAILVVL